jgi:outer membrane protein, heavy metal efflux system
LTLTEADALARLSAGSPRARAARAGVEVARADVLNVGRWPNPRVTVDRESVAGVTENIVMVAQPLPITGRRGLEVQAASAIADATASRADEDIRRLRADLRLAFAELVAAQIREEQLTTARDRLRGLADILGKRESAGDAAGFDRLRADREVLEIDTDRALAAADRARAQAILASFFTDAGDPAQLLAMAPPAAPTQVPSLDALVERAESTRGELQAWRHEVEAADFAQRAADRRWIPEPEVVAGSKSSNTGGGDIGSVITVHASIPLFDRGQPERALATARAAQAESRAAAFRLVLRGQLAALRVAVLERRAVAERYRSHAVSGGDQIARIAQVSYDAGERSILELLDAYRTGLSARVRQAVLDAAVRQAEIELEFVSGWEIR